MYTAHRHRAPAPPTRWGALRALGTLAALLLATAGLASGCATRMTTAAGRASAGRGDQLEQAAASPLNDLNLVQIEIPPVLLAAKAQPYATPARLDCAPLLAEVMTLDAALGPDVDAPPPPSKDSSVADTGAQVVGDAAVTAFRNAVENLVPFRGWVRRLSGANEHERDVAAALAAGTARRAYLKGLMRARGCLTLSARAVDAAAQPASAPGAPLVPAQK
jgi:hypothetical protein